MFEFFFWLLFMAQALVIVADVRKYYMQGFPEIAKSVGLFGVGTLILMVVVYWAVRKFKKEG